jgi:uncharacterized protein (TIGR03067 family)
VRGDVAAAGRAITIRQEVDMLTEALMLATLGVSGVAVGSQRVAGAKDPGELQGKWTAVRAEQDGREAADIVGHVLLIENGKFRIQEKGVTIYEGTLGLDESARPWAIDFKHTNSSSQGKTWRGIYRIDGDTLTVCDNAGAVQKARPMNFETRTDSGLVLVVFKRAQQ